MNARNNFRFYVLPRQSKAAIATFGVFYFLKIDPVYCLLQFFVGYDSHSNHYYFRENSW